MAQNMITVILPTYNEKGNVIPLIGEIHKNLNSYNHEIVVVDDNSPDDTFKEVQDLNFPFVRPILRTENRGLANSIRCGLENAHGDICVVMDSDFNHKPEYLPFMVDSLKYYDFVSASRFLYGGSMDSRIRHILSWLFNIFVRLTTGGKINDNLYGYFAVKKEIIEKLDYDKVFWGYGDYYIRLLYFLQKNRANILQFPAVNGRRLSGVGQSKFIGVFWQYFRETIKLALKGRMRNV
jgi:dolichol-phosphate mannosyltransferase